MLRRFSVEGFRGFKDKIVFDLGKIHDYAYNRELVVNDLVKGGVIYGENGSGKTNLGAAIFDISRALTDFQRIPESIVDENTFLNADGSLQRAKFTYEFKFGKDDVVYSYTKSGLDIQNMECVTLNGHEILRFSRDTGEFLVSKKNMNGIELQPTLSAVRYVYRNTDISDDHPIAKIIRFVEKMLWFRSLNHRGYAGYQLGAENIIDALIGANKIKDFEKFLSDMAGLHVRLDTIENPITHKPILVSRHSERILEFSKSASTGTSELLLVYYWSQFAFNDVSFLFVDEFDAFYHFELSAKIMNFILKKSNGQAFVTSHNTALLNNDGLRPDCCFRIGGNQIVSFADSTDRELRVGHNLEKLYRNGEFDA